MTVGANSDTLLCSLLTPPLPASTQFGISLTQVNWLANSVNLIYLPSSIATPFAVQRWGIRTAVGRNSYLSDHPSNCRDSVYSGRFVCSSLPGFVMQARSLLISHEKEATLS